MLIDMISIQVRPCYEDILSGKISHGVQCQCGITMLSGNRDQINLQLYAKIALTEAKAGTVGLA